MLASPQPSVKLPPLAPRIPPPRLALDVAQLVADVESTVPGHLHPLESITLFSLAASLRPGALVVELGSLVGKSTTLLGAGLLSVGGGKIHAVDLYAIPRGGRLPSSEALGQQHADLSNDYKLPDLFRERSQLEVFNDHMQAVGLGGIAEAVVSDSAAYAAAFSAAQVDLLFVDASHHYEDVRRDLVAWLPKVRSGGVIACHDYNPEGFPGVVRAVSEILLEPDAVVGPMRLQNLFVSRKR